MSDDGHVGDARRTAVSVVAVAAIMGGLSFAAVPFYNWICRVTGFDGTTMVAETESDAVLEQRIRVFFDANVDDALPWRFEPEQASIMVRLGETAVVFYRATNLSDQPVTGSATFGVAPAQIGGYFAKMECFCFTEQTLQPGESVLMPVSFFVDPALAEDPENARLSTVTLSYTFYETTPTADAGGDALETMR